MRKLLVELSLLVVAFQGIAQSDVKEIVLSELRGFGVQVTQMGIKENRGQSISLRFGVPEVDSNNCMYRSSYHLTIANACTLLLDGDSIPPAADL